MAVTNFGLLTDEQKTTWSMDFWSQARNLSFINKFLGKSENSVIQHITELKKSENPFKGTVQEKKRKTDAYHPGKGRPGGWRKKKK